ncbi:MAG: hypothetical protein LBF42_04175, partial [Puniceicoccales bacterium]|nr:hypothetical protein [Puniceicoccales bacterium]
MRRVAEGTASTYRGDMEISEPDEIYSEDFQLMRGGIKFQPLRTSAQVASRALATRFAQIFSTHPDLAMPPPWLNEASEAWTTNNPDRFFDLFAKLSPLEQVALCKIVNGGGKTIPIFMAEEASSDIFREFLDIFLEFPPADQVEILRIAYKGNHKDPFLRRASLPLERLERSALQLSSKSEFGDIFPMAIGRHASPAAFGRFLEIVANLDDELERATILLATDRGEYQEATMEGKSTRCTERKYVKYRFSMFVNHHIDPNFHIFGKFLDILTGLSALHRARILRETDIWGTTFPIHTLSCNSIEARDPADLERLFSMIAELDEISITMILEARSARYGSLSQCVADKIRDQNLLG